MTKHKLIFIGSSHAKRLCREAYYIEKITNIYKIVDFSRPCSLFENLVWAERSTLTKNDIIVFQSFGNNLLQRHTYKDGGIVHLTKFVPNKLSYLALIFSQLIDKLSEYPCKIYILIIFIVIFNAAKNIIITVLYSFKEKQMFYYKKPLRQKLFLI